jgi:hypothetical protein
MRRILIFHIAIVAAFLCSCQNKEKKEITQIVKEWQGKEIVFPEKMIFTQFGQDTVPYSLSESPYKIVMYVDSIGCTSCKLQLHKWKEFITELDSLTRGTVPVLFIFHPKDKREISYLLKRDDINIPVCIDEKDRINALNRFPENQSFQCFLIDSGNKVVYIGNPVHNPRIREMYLRQVTENRYVAASGLSQNTRIRIEQTDFDLGKLKQGNAASVSVAIKNTGDKPFIIFDTKKSCGCTAAIYDKKPVEPGHSTEIKITYRAEDIGFFNKTVSVFCNTDTSPLIIRLKGTVVQ